MLGEHSPLTKPTSLIMMRNKEYHDFCVSIKDQFGLNINPDDEFFPLVYSLMDSNNKNKETINELKELLTNSLLELKDTNQNLYANQSFLLSKNEALINKIPKEYIRFNSEQSAIAYWKGKFKYYSYLVLATAFLITSSMISYLAFQENSQIHWWIMNSKIETHQGKQYLLLNKVSSLEDLENNGTCIEWNNNQIAVPIDN